MYIHTYLYPSPFTHFSETNLKVRQALPETHDQFVSDAEEGPRLLMDAVTKFDGTFSHALDVRGVVSQAAVCVFLCRLRCV